MRVRYAVLGACVLLSVASAASAAAVPQVVPFGSSQPGEVLVPVTIDGAGPYRFLLDTGSTHTAIAEELAAKLRLEAVAQASLATSVGTSLCRVVRMTEVAIGSARVDVLLATALPHAAGSVLGDGADGIIGQDFLSRFNYTLDYRESRLRWDEVPAGGNRLELRSSQGRFVVTLPQHGRADQAIQLVPDSGSAGLVLFRTAATQDLRLIDGPDLLRVASVTGEALAQRVTVASLQVGRQIFGNLPAVAVSPPHQDEAGDGLLPLDLFGRVAFNNRDGYMVLEPK